MVVLGIEHSKPYNICIYMYMFIAIPYDRMEWRKKKRFHPLLTLIPSQRDTARNGRNALRVRIERNAGMSAAPAQIAPKFIKDN